MVVWCGMVCYLWQGSKREGWFCGMIFFCDAQVPRVRLVGQAYLESNRVSDLAKNYVIPGGKTQYYRGRLNVLFCV